MAKFIIAMFAITFQILRFAIYAMMKKEKNQLFVLWKAFRMLWLLKIHGNIKGFTMYLGGIISPIDGIGPSDLKIDSLEEKVKDGGVKEIIFALSTTMEGDTTNYYLFRRLHKYEIILTTLARGVAIGDELEYTDEITLGRAINNRNPYQQ